MRSRYTAYTRQDIQYILATHHPDTVDTVDRAAAEKWARESTWLGLKILAVSDGGPEDSKGTVEFAARWRQHGEEFTHVELSTFAKCNGRWFYVEGTTPKRSPLRKEEKPSPNAPCPCGSGKKYKRCHGLGA